MAIIKGGESRDYASPKSGQRPLKQEITGEKGIKDIIEFEYDRTNKKIKETRTDANGKIYEEREFEYDADGRVGKETIKKTGPDGQLRYEGMRACEYDVNGNLTREEAWDEDNKIVYVNEFSYNEKNLLAQRISKNPGGGVMMTSEYGYDEQGRKTHAVSKEADGAVQEDVEFSYDDKNRLSQAKYSYPHVSAGKLKDNFVFRYNYATEGNTETTKRTAINSSTGKQISETREITTLAA